MRFGIGQGILNQFGVAVAGGMGRTAVVALVHQVYLETQVGPGPGVAGPVVAHSKKTVQDDKRAAAYAQNFA
jgi:hypothetical protein